LDLKEAFEKLAASETETSDDLDTAASQRVPDETFQNVRLFSDAKGRKNQI
jgi:hypothetical protein